MRSGDMKDWQNGFINSNRGHFILAQALVIAIKELDKVPGAMKEVSNISDMQYLLDNYFDVYQQIHTMDMGVKTSVAERQIEFQQVAEPTLEHFGEYRIISDGESD